MRRTVTGRNCANRSRMKWTSKLATWSLYANLASARSRAFTASTSRFFAGLAVDSESSSRRAVSLTSATARSNAASLAREGCVNPESLRTNCKAEARISSSVAGGSKLNKVRILRHIEVTPVSSFRVRPEVVGPDDKLRAEAGIHNYRKSGLLEVQARFQCGADRGFQPRPGMSG